MRTKLSDYRVSLAGPLGIYWQDKRGDGDTVYQRHFPDKWALADYLIDHFGARVANQVFKDNEPVLGRE